MEISLFQAVLMGGYYWFANISLIYGASWGRPLVVGIFMGLILGDLKTAIMISAMIQPMFIVFTGAGGTVVWDPNAGTIAGCAITMAGGLAIDQALTVAIPVSLMAAQLHTIRRIWFAYPAQKADQAALVGNDRAIAFYATWFCVLSKIVIYWLPMSIAMALGVEVIGDMMNALPQWITNALSAAGGILPSLGFAMTIRVIGRRNLMPFFLGGFFLVQYTGIGGMFLALIGLFFTFLYYLIMDATKKERDTQFEKAERGIADMDEDHTKHMLTIKDVNRLFRRWQLCAEMSNSFARLQSISFCYAFLPVLKKLYGHDFDEYTAALTRHLMFFNTQGIWGSVIHGMVLAMEEQRALGAPIDAAAIIGIKSGLMGPFAGIGDTVDWSTLFPLITILVLPLADAGSALGGILQFALLLGIVTAEGNFFCRTGYRLGTRAASTILDNKNINTFIMCASVLGMFMMGGLSASMIKVSTPVYIPTSGTPMMVQKDILDQVAPGLLTLISVLGVYRFLQKGNTMMKATLLLLCIGLVLGSVGIIGNGGLLFGPYQTGV